MLYKVTNVKYYLKSRKCILYQIKRAKAIIVRKYFEKLRRHRLHVE